MATLAAVGLVVAVVVAVALLATYVTYTAQRLDRLHARVDASAGALEANLLRRAAAATALAGDGGLPPEVARELAGAARAAARVEGLGAEREVAESGLTRALRAAATTAGFVDGVPLVDELVDAATKAAFARRFHNDAVRDTLALRGGVVPRLLRLAGSAPSPRYFEIDDTPIGLVPGAVRR